MERNLPDFLIIPSIIIEDKELQPLDGYVYALIYWYTKLKLQKCIASNKTIAELLNSHPLSVSRSISNLEKHSYIRVIIDRAEGNKREIIPLIKFGVSEAIVTDTYKPNSLYPINQTVNTYKPNSEHNNIDLIRKTNNISVTPKKYSSIKDITEEDFNEIATKYKVSPAFVKLQYEKLVNYCESKGRKYKNYKSALRNFVLGDMQRTVERRSENVRVGIDASWASKR